MCQWGREPYCFPPKSSQVFEEWKARFFAKHLTNRELLKVPQGEMHTSPKMKNGEYYSDEDDSMFMEIYRKCFIPMETEYASEEKLKDAVMNNPIPQVTTETSPDAQNGTKARFCDQCDSKGVRHLKTCPTVDKTAESEFQGL